MSTHTEIAAPKKVRVQVDLSETEATMLHHLAERLAVRSRADLLQQAYGIFLWVVNELLSGRRIVSVTPEMLRTIDKCKELSVPAVEPLLFNHYDYLVARPETGYKQLYLKGRNMRVGQLIYKMRANQLSLEEAASDMDLPVAQIREAQVYYAVNRDLVEQEAAEEKQHLHAAGVVFGSQTLS
ncbi:MAG: hypothetical protein KF832_29635 [Caldilineaceae bacterium]|nr:hypothetical protein [Caldilineaceae bacterium]